MHNDQRQSTLHIAIAATTTHIARGRPEGQSVRSNIYLFTGVTKFLSHTM